MCGIAGFSGSDPEARRTVAAMIAALAHRGPDGSGIFVDRGIALGHCRLAIIDPRGGAQPRIDPDSGDALIFNGEIYGYRALQDELRAAGLSGMAGSASSVTGGRGSIPHRPVSSMRRQQLIASTNCCGIQCGAA